MNDNNILRASKGMVLTNGIVYLKKIYLGCNDKAENYYEITNDEYAEILSKTEEGASL